jgi:hypothetical protein
MINNIIGKDNSELKESVPPLTSSTIDERLSLWDMIKVEEFCSMWSIVILLLSSFYSPWTFNRANPKERPNKVIKKQTTAAVTISGLAYGNIFTINAIIYDIFNFKYYKKFK